MIQTPEATEGKKAELAELASISRYLPRRYEPRAPPCRPRPRHPRRRPTSARRRARHKSRIGPRPVQERRAKLLGLDEPAKSRIEVITADVIEAEIRRLEGKLGLEGRLTEADL